MKSCIEHNKVLTRKHVFEDGWQLKTVAISKLQYKGKDYMQAMTQRKRLHTKRRLGYTLKVSELRLLLHVSNSLNGALYSGQ